MCEEEEITEEESPQLSAAFGLVEPTAVEQLARPEAISQRVEDQVLGGKKVQRKQGMAEESCSEISKLSSVVVKNGIVAVPA